MAFTGVKHGSLLLNHDESMKKICRGAGIKSNSNVLVKFALWSDPKI